MSQLYTIDLTYELCYFEWDDDPCYLMVATSNGYIGTLVETNEDYLLGIF